MKEEIIKAKDNLVKELTDSIVKFSNLTGLKIEVINITQIDTGGVRDILRIEPKIKF